MPEIDVHQLFSFFPDLDARQQEQLRMLKPVYSDWNSRINLISRQDMDGFYLHHVLHSLAVFWYAGFRSGDLVLDVGTGGGFPGIPLAILLPGCSFLLIDSTAKKLNVVDDVCKELGISNVETKHARIEDLKIKHEIMVSRAVSALPTFVSWVMPSLRLSGKNHRGIFYLKGGDCEEEARATRMEYRIFNLYERLPFEYFETKKLIRLRMK